MQLEATVEPAVTPSRSVRKVRWHRGCHRACRLSFTRYMLTSILSQWSPVMTLISVHLYLLICGPQNLSLEVHCTPDVFPHLHTSYTYVRMHA